jgi:hypothetical protein
VTSSKALGIAGCLVKAAAATDNAAVAIAGAEIAGLTTAVGLHQMLTVQQGLNSNQLFTLLDVQDHQMLSQIPVMLDDGHL